MIIVQFKISKFSAFAALKLKLIEYQSYAHPIMDSGPYLIFSMPMVVDQNTAQFTNEFTAQFLCISGVWVWTLAPVLKLDRS
jgi:hypothetical protein